MIHVGKYAFCSLNQKAIWSQLWRGIIRKLAGRRIGAGVAWRYRLLYSRTVLRSGDAAKCSRTNIGSRLHSNSQEPQVRPSGRDETASTEGVWSRSGRLCQGIGPAGPGLDHPCHWGLGLGQAGPLGWVRGAVMWFPACWGLSSLNPLLTPDRQAWSPLDQTAVKRCSNIHPTQTALRVFPLHSAKLKFLDFISKSILARCLWNIWFFSVAATITIMQ